MPSVEPQEQQDMQTDIRREAVKSVKLAMTAWMVVMSKSSFHDKQMYVLHNSGTLKGTVTIHLQQQHLDIFGSFVFSRTKPL